MVHGPTGSHYPGKYVCFAMATFFAALAWRSSRFAMRAMEEQRRRATQGICVKPDAKKSVGANVWVALIAMFLLASVLADIYAHWPN